MLSFIGVIISSLLMIQHYYPSSDIAAATCGDGISNPCHALSISGYGTFLGMPVAAYGLLFYLFIIFIVLIADYAGDHYVTLAAGSAAILCTAGVITDIVLAIILIITGYLCTLCIASYAVNIALVILSVSWIRNLPDQNDTHFPQAAKKAVYSLNSSPGDRAALASFTLFSLVLAFGVLSTTYIMNIKTAGKRLSEAKIMHYVQKFYDSEIENIQLPGSALMVGKDDAPLTISLFTDFLCSACYSFYLTETYITTRYPDSVKLFYYNLPLDKNCNSHISRTVYHNSCTASKALIAANRLGILHEYMTVHFKHYKKIKRSYSEKDALFILNEVNNTRKDPISPQKFQNMMHSPDTQNSLDFDIETAHEHGVTATPTLFVSGRRMRGSPPREVFEAIIKSELEKNKHNKSKKE